MSGLHELDQDPLADQQGNGVGADHYLHHPLVCPLGGVVRLQLARAKETLQQSRAAISSATGTSLTGFSFPKRGDGAPNAGAGAGAPAEDDLYS